MQASPVFTTRITVRACWQTPVRQMLLERTRASKTFRLSLRRLKLHFSIDG